MIIVDILKDRPDRRFDKNTYHGSEHSRIESEAFINILDRIGFSKYADECFGIHMKEFGANSIKRDKHTLEHEKLSKK